jgi:endogenous inhibitor of DNA gyrase (YacG/DUF329 family)
MRKLVALAALVLALAAFGCTPAKKVPNGKTLVKCPTCAVEFTVKEGIPSQEADHKQKILVKCPTCAVEFTVAEAPSPQEAGQMRKILVKCPTCAVEFPVEEGMRPQEADHNH